MTKLTQKATKVPSLPALPNNVDPQLRQYLENLSEATEVRLGRRGDPRDRAITLRELIDSGLAEQLKVSPFDPNNPLPDFLPPTDPGASTRPPKPTGFTATAGYSNVIMFWDLPDYPYYAHTEVWRHDSDTLGDATLLGVSNGTSYVDELGGNLTRYYWIRHVSTFGIAGEWFSSTGSSATTAADVDYLLTELAGAITTSELATALSTRIDLIDAAASVSGSVNKRIEDVRSTLQSQLDDIEAIADYDGATSYVVDDLVKSGGNLYRCISATTGNAPPNATYWELIGEYSSLGEAVADNTSDISAINFIDATSTSAAATAIKQLQVDVTAAEGDITTNASNISANTTDIATNGTDITTNATAITALETTVNNGTTGVAANASNISANTADISTNATDISTNASAITALETTVNNGTTGVAANASNISVNTTDIATNASDISTNASAITVLQTTVNDGSTGVAANAANISTNTASISTNAGNITANASSITTLTTTVNGNTTSIQTNATSIDGIHGQYTVKIDANGRVAGFGLSNTSETYDGGIHSEFIVLSDRFSIVNQNDNGDLITPFIVTTATTINGESVPAGVYINDAYIRNGTIVQAKIADLAVDTAKIADLAVSAAKIDDLAVTTAKIADLAVTGAKIQNAAITNAKIGTAAITEAKIADLAVDTIKIAGGAVSDSAFTTSSGGTASISHAARSGSVLLFAIFYPTNTSSRTVTLYRDAVVLRSFTISSAVPIIIMYVDTPGTATYSYQAVGTSGTFNATELLLLEVVK